MSNKSINTVREKTRKMSQEIEIQTEAFLKAKGKIQVLSCPQVSPVTRGPVGATALNFYG